MIKLIEVILRILNFENIDPKTIKHVGSNLGVIYFESDGITYTVCIHEVVDEPEPPNPF